MNDTVTTEAGTAAAPPALRASSYVIYVDLPHDATHFLLVHGYTGAYDLVSRDVAGFIRALESRNVPRPLYGHWEPEEMPVTTGWKPDEESIAALKRRGYLTTKTHDEEVATFTKFVEQWHAASVQQQPSYIVMPTYDWIVPLGVVYEGGRLG